MTSEENKNIGSSPNDAAMHLINAIYNSKSGKKLGFSRDASKEAKNSIIRYSKKLIDTAHQTADNKGADGVSKSNVEYARHHLANNNRKKFLPFIVTLIGSGFLGNLLSNLTSSSYQIGLKDVFLGGITSAAILYGFFKR